MSEERLNNSDTIIDIISPGASVGESEGSSGGIAGGQVTPRAKGGFLLNSTLLEGS